MYGHITHWDVSSVTNMDQMFFGHSYWNSYYRAIRTFNQPLAWDVSSVTSMNQMFYVRSAACLCASCPTPPATQDASRLLHPLPPRLA